MTSQIDITVPVFGNPRTEDERRNWQTASQEITALQASVEEIEGGGVGGGGRPVAITQTIVTLLSNADTILAPVNANRKSLALITIGSSDVTLGFGATAVIGQGWPLPSATSSAKTGVPMMWEQSPPIGAVHGISAANTTVVVLEGVEP